MGLMMTCLTGAIAIVDCHSCVPSATVNLGAIELTILQNSTAFVDLAQGLAHV